MDAKSIFLDAIELPPDERDVFLTEACGGDDSLAGRVRSLIEAHQRAEREEESGPAFPEVPSIDDLGDPAPAPRDLDPGTHLGPYRLVEEICRGGFGRVWLAEQEAPLRRRVAVKVLKAGLDTEEILARFHAERQAQAMMDHANIARVFDAGATDRGLPWFAMEFVDGDPITEYCAERGLNAGERLRLFVDACRAVQHAHQKGVIHRDVKPSNVLVTEVDGAPTPKVIDFGIAKAIEQSLVGDALRTRADQLIGTPAFMSPEQVDPSLDVDTRTDVYSLGVLLYQMLTGSTPFEGESGEPLSTPELLAAITTREPARPSSRLLRCEVRASAEALSIRARQLRGELDWIVMRCLEKDRERRYDSPAALADDVERHLAGDTVLAGPPTVSYRLSKLARRYRSVLVFTTVLFLLLAGGIVAATTQASRARAAERASALETARAKEELERYESIAGLLEHILMSIDPARAGDLDTALLRDVLHRARSEVERRDLQPVVEATVRRVIGGAYLSIARYPEAEVQMRRALALRLEFLGAEDEETLDSEEELGGLLLKAGAHEEGLEHLTRAQAGRARVLGPDHEQTVHARVNVAVAKLRLGRAEEAEQELRELRAWHLEHYGEEHPQTLLVMNNLASALQAVGSSEEALEIYQRLVPLHTAVEGEEHPRTLSALNNLGSLLAELGRTEEALPLIERALEVKRRILPQGHPSLLISLSTMARMHTRMGDLEVAELIYDEALAEGLEILGERDRHVLILRFNRARLLGRQGRRAEALEELEALLPAVEATEPVGSELLEALHTALTEHR